jgi:glycosyltransferase involved in cell wall biosynthesis
MKRVLIISYYWPPSGGGGVQRWLKFAKYLPEYGVEPIVVTPLNPEIPSVDHSLLKDISEELLVIKIPIFEPYNLFKKLTGRSSTEKVNTGLLLDDKKRSLVEKIMLWIRGNFIIPDPRIFWKRPVVKHILKRFDELNPDLIITTGPPHSMHLIGEKIAKKTGVKWLADFRDPWSNLDILDFFYPTKYAIKKHIRLEQKVMNSASGILTVSPTWAKEMQMLTNTPVYCITNGYDEQDFLNFDKLVKQNKGFQIGHFGIITSLRNPIALWEVLNELCIENNSFFDNLDLRMAGVIDDSVKNIIETLPMLKQRVTYLPYLNHDDLFQEYANSNILLLLLNQSKNALGHIPGKLFEYLATTKAILGIGNSNSDASNILSSVGENLMVSLDDKHQIKSFLLKKFNEHIEGKQDKIGINPSVKKYARNNLTEQLVRLIDDMYSI